MKALNGKPRDECLNVHQFLSIEDATSKIEVRRLEPASTPQLTGSADAQEGYLGGQQTKTKKPRFSGR